MDIFHYKIERVWKQSKSPHSSRSFRAFCEGLELACFYHLPIEWCRCNSLSKIFKLYRVVKTSTCSEEECIIAVVGWCANITKNMQLIKLQTKSECMPSECGITWLTPFHSQLFICVRSIFSFVIRCIRGNTFVTIRHSPYAWTRFYLDFVCQGLRVVNLESRSSLPILY